MGIRARSPRLHRVVHVKLVDGTKKRHGQTRLACGCVLVPQPRLLRPPGVRFWTEDTGWRREKLLIGYIFNVKSCGGLGHVTDGSYVEFVG